MDRDEQIGRLKMELDWLKKKAPTAKPVTATISERAVSRSWASVVEAPGAVARATVCAAAGSYR